MHIPFFNKQNLGIKASIEAILTSELEGSDYFIVDIKSNEEESAIQVYVDGYKGIGIADCAKLSRAVSRQLDEMEIEQEKLKFEISSPGADKPLTDKRQYFQHLGRELEVENDNSMIRGTLHKVDDEKILLEIITDKKKKTKEIIPMEFTEIKKATVQISFKSVKK